MGSLSWILSPKIQTIISWFTSPGLMGMISSDSRGVSIVKNILPFILILALGFSSFDFDNNPAFYFIYILGGIIGFLKVMIIGSKHVSDVTGISKRQNELRSGMQDLQQTIFRLTASDSSAMDGDSAKHTGSFKKMETEFDDLNKEQDAVRKNESRITGILSLIQIGG